MKFRMLAAVLFLAAFPAFAQNTSQWQLLQSTLTYHVSSPVHQVEGVSKAAKGKGRAMQFSGRGAGQVVQHRRHQPRPAHA
jgi:hypothetical protein